MYSYNKSEQVAAPTLVSKRLLDQVRERMLYLHYSHKKEQSCLYLNRFLYFGNQKKGGVPHLAEIRGTEVKAFLAMLANKRQVSPSTHRQALHALLFLHRGVLCLDWPWLAQIGHPPKRKRIAVVLPVAKVHMVLGLMQGLGGMARLLYGAGMGSRWLRAAQPACWMPWRHLSDA